MGRDPGPGFLRQSPPRPVFHWPRWPSPIEISARYDRSQDSIPYHAADWCPAQLPRKTTNSFGAVSSPWDCCQMCPVPAPRGEFRERRETTFAELRVCQEITDALWRERRGGRWEAPRRRRCRCASSRSGNKADAPAPLWAGVRRHAGVVTRSLHTAQRVCASLSPSQRTWGPQQSVSVTS